MKPMRRSLLLSRLFLSSVVLVCAGSMGAAQDSKALTVTDLIKAIKAHHPVIQSAEARREQADTEQQRAQGAFDLRVNQATRSRISGFYDGQYLDQSVTKPLAFSGVDVTAGYRYSNGDFPIYENDRFTRSAGEASVGIKVPLLRDRAIDARRIGLMNADRLKSLGMTEEQIAVNQFIFHGINAYFNWYEAYLQNGAVAELVTLVETRREGVVQRVASGDLAAITLTEFETTLLTRQIGLAEARQSLAVAQQQLLFYWRDDAGSSLPVESLKPPALPIPWPFPVISFDEVWQQTLVSNHPTIVALEEKIRLAENESRLAENNLLPDFDLDMKVGRDFGSGTANLDRPETYIGVTFSMPLERNKAKADQQSADAKIRELTLLRRAQLDRLRVQLNEGLLRLATYAELRALRRQQATVAKQLERQEHARFDAGNSDQFLLNARESQAAQAKLESIGAEVDWIRQKLVLTRLSFDLARF
ncbi:MAG: outer membrane protein TolC [Candidatus Azotimanducaceae bacterium]|jgi:outer membrane protein TolC